LEQTIFDKKYTALRRALIEKQYEKLNPAQREAVMHTRGPLLVLAGAGSGKTTVLINRIANLVRFGDGAAAELAPEGAGMPELAQMAQELEVPGTLDAETVSKLCAVNPVRPWNILAITFTNKAAGELKARLERTLGPAAADIWASTFHSACARILRRDIDRLGFERSFTIYDEDERQSVLRGVLKELRFDEKLFVPRAISNIISRAKDALMDAEAFEKAEDDQRTAASDVRRADIARIYRLYTRRMHEANALDFDDLIFLTVRLLREQPEVREYYQNKFRYVMVDEYQDTNPAQDELTHLLAGGYENLCVVGDDDQSIYRFRGATVRNILEFEKTYPTARVIRLEQNYRSTQTILDAANAVIRNNEERRGKELWTQAAGGDKISFYAGQTEGDEAQYIAAQILAGYRNGFTPRDFAVLYRINAQSNAIENAFKRNGIPYRIVGGMRFFDRAEVKDMLAYLCAIENHADTMRLRRIINNPPRRISDTRVEKAMEVAVENSIHLYDVLRDAESFGVFDRAAQPMQAFAEMLEELRLQADAMPLDEFYDLVLEKTGYLAMLEAKKDIESMTRAENVQELKSSIVNYVKDNDSPTLTGFLEEVALFTDIDRYDDSADAAVMMTLHAAKGLEFPHVFLCGMEEGIFPGIRSANDPESLEEERRLCYVGITRAKKNLHISCTRQRTIFGRTSYNKQSRFLDEIPPECIDRDPAAQKAAPQRNFAAQRPQRKPPAPIAAPSILSRPAQQTGKAVLFRTGDKLVHKAFGPGIVRQTLPMGGDMLLTVEFENPRHGTKRLMANTAAQFITKVTE